MREDPPLTVAVPYNLYWVSNKHSKYSTLIRNNPDVAIVIFDSRAPEGEGDGVYFEAAVEELTSEIEITHDMEIFNKRVMKDEFRIKRMTDVAGDGLSRMEKAVPKKVSKLTEGAFVNGHSIDKRVDIELN